MPFRTTLAAAAVAIGTTSAAQAPNIVEIAAGDERFSTLVAALQAAGLAETPSGPGPFTGYAPTDAAFAALPDRTVKTLLEPANKSQLTDVLLYHSDDRRLRSVDFPAGANFFKPLLTSERLGITAHDGVCIADGTGESANVVVADITADRHHPRHRQGAAAGRAARLPLMARLGAAA